MNFLSETGSDIQTVVTLFNHILINMDDFGLDDIQILFLYRNANKMVLHFSGKISINEVVRLKTKLIEHFVASIKINLERYNLNKLIQINFVKYKYEHYKMNLQN